MVSEDDFPFGDGYEDVDIKEALGLPDSLPPLRLPSLPELAALARQAPLPRQLDGLVAWVGADGRAVTEDGLLTEPFTSQASAAVGVASGDLAYLWEYAFAAEWLRYDDDDDECVVP